MQHINTQLTKTEDLDDGTTIYHFNNGDKISINRIHCYNSNISKIDSIPGLWIGDYDVACNMELLETHAITHIISLYRMPVFPDNYEYMCVNIEDIETENISKYFGETNAFIDKGLRDGYGVLVHCAAGISRSAAIIIAYIMKKMK